MAIDRSFIARRQRPMHNRSTITTAGSHQRRSQVNRFRLAILSLCLCVSVAHSKTEAENWPQYRGPDRTGIVTEKNLAQSWPDEGPKELWRKPTGTGFASPIAADGKLFLFYLNDGKDVLEA